MLEITPELLRLIDRALEEDQVFNDATTNALIDPGAGARGLFRAEAPGILAGLDAALAVFRRIEPTAAAERHMSDGDTLSPGDTIAVVAASASAILRGERLALNLLQRMSGIATATARYVAEVEGAGASAQIIDTRKTAPGLRALDKYAVRAGGGKNHRAHLADGVLIKDNHVDFLRGRGLSLAEVVELARRRASHTLKIEIEVSNLAELEDALNGRPDIVLLDNMSVDEMKAAVEVCGGRALLEASGGITLGNVGAVAAGGVDLISVGALTHSVKALDISLDIETL